MTDVHGSVALATSDAVVATADAVERLAERLYAGVRRLDPIEDEPEWPALPEDDQRFYRGLIEDLVRCPDLPQAVVTEAGCDSAKSPRMTRRIPMFSLILWVLLATAAVCGGLALGPETMSRVISSLQSW